MRTRRTTWLVTVASRRKADGPKWYVHVTPPAGFVDEHGVAIKPGRVSTRTEDRPEAERFAREKAAELNREMPAQELDAGDLSVDRVLELNSEWRRKNKSPENTLDKIVSARKALASTLGPVRASRLDRAAVILAQDDLRLRVTGATVNNYLGLAGSAWRWAFARGLVGCDWPRVKKMKIQKTKKRPLTDDEVRALVGHLRTFSRGHWLPIFVFLWDSGCRVGDACALLEEHVNRATGEVKIGNEKGKEPYSVWIGSETLALMPVRKPGDPIFRAKRSWQHASRDSVNSVMDRAIVALGLDPKMIDLHSLRRTRVKDLARTPEIPRALAMRLTGHKTLSVFMGYERNTVGDDLREAAGQAHALRCGVLGTTTCDAVRPHVDRVPESPANPPGLLRNSGDYDAARNAQDAVASMDMTRAGLAPASSSDPVTRTARADPAGVQRTALDAEKAGDLRRSPEVARDQLWRAHPIAAALNTLANLGREVRDALRLVCADPEVKAGLASALADGWPDEQAPASETKLA